jgi:dTDP-4-amino-4,6-dideoxygalactose transaminase
MILISHMINVTKTFLPPYHKYEALLKQIWASGRITNNGTCCLQLEERLQEYLGVRNVVLVNNGTIAIQIALKALDLNGEIITTPFSYVATTSSIHWEGLSAVYADIDPRTLCINPDTVSDRISGSTSAILPTHIFGYPCDNTKLEQISKQNGLKLIYDAAHAFGVKQDGHSILNWGDCSTLSFHATKLFHTIEGGAVVCQDDDLADTLRYMRNFGHLADHKYAGVGINGKISEFHAAMGLCILEYVDRIIDERMTLSQHYDSRFLGSHVEYLSAADDVRYNYSYYPVLLATEDILHNIVNRLSEASVAPRRYFYPSLNTLPYVKQLPCPVSEDISSRVLCLPLYSGLKISEIDTICDIILRTGDKHGSDVKRI